MGNSLKKALIILSIIGLLTYCHKQSQRAKLKKIEKFAQFSPMQDAHKYFYVRIEVQATNFGSFLLYYDPMHKDVKEPFKTPLTEEGIHTIGRSLHIDFTAKNLQAFLKGTELYNTIRIYSETMDEGLAREIITIFKKYQYRALKGLLES